MKGEEIVRVFSAESLCDLANKFLRQEMYDEAIALLEQACALYPDHLTLKVQLGRCREALRNASEQQHLSSKATAVREALDLRACLLDGLADVHLRRGEAARSIELLKEAARLSPYNFYHYLQLGRLHYENKEYAAAVDALTRGKALNPFHEDLCYYLALSYFYVGKHEEALMSMLDALVLSGDLEKQGTSPYQQKIQLILEKFPNFDRNNRNQLVKQRQLKFKQLYDATLREIHQGPPLPQAIDEPLAAATPRLQESPTNAHESPYLMLSRLRKFFLLRNLDEKILGKLAGFCREQLCKEGDHVYKEGSPVQGLFLVEKGEIRLQKETPMGDIQLLQIAEGRFFGDEELLFDNQTRLAALAVGGDAQLLVLDRGAILKLFQEDQEIALHFYWYFWKSLAFQIRHANELLKSFFTAPKSVGVQEPQPKQEQRQRRREQHFELALNQKESALRASGLDNEELKLLAQHCSEEFYNAGERIFREGDAGDKLYVIAAGEVVITKRIEGVGDEALAILGKGDFFGEMALIDGQTRSADAKAHKPGTTVLAIRRDVLKELLSMDNKSACNFLVILYRLLHQRLQEIREKIFNWKIMAGGF